MNADVLSKTVIEAYEKIDSKVFARVFKRWKLVLKLIRSGRGSNNLVEAHRGLKVNLADLPTIPSTDSDDEETVQDLIKRAEEESETVLNEV